MTSKNLFLSKIQTAYECPRKYFHSYHSCLGPKEKPDYFQTGTDFHECVEVLLTEGPEKAYEKAESVSNEMMFYLKVFAEKFYDLNPAVLGTERPVIMPINNNKFFDAWVVKSDSTLQLKNGALWNGEWKTAGGYGASTARYYYNSLQTLTYNYVIKKHMPDIRGTKLFVVTKTKTPVCHVEDIMISQKDLDRAELFIEDAIEYLTEIEERAEYPRHQTSCTHARQQECMFLPICFEKNENYVNEIIPNLYSIHDPDAHLEL